MQWRKQVIMRIGQHTLKRNEFVRKGKGDKIDGNPGVSCGVDWLSFWLLAKR